MSSKMRWSLRQKVSLGACAIVVSLAVAMMSLTNLSITQAMKGKVEDDLLAAQGVFEQFQRLRFQQLLIFNNTVAEIPHLKAVVTTPGLDHATILDSAQAAQQLIQSDLLMLTDERGRLLASVAEPTRFGDNLSETPAFTSALRGELFQGIWMSEKKIYQVVASPILFGDNIAGALLTGFAVDSSLVQVLEQMTNSHVAMIGSKELVTSSAGADLFAKLRQTLPLTDQEEPGLLVTTTIDGERYVVLKTPLGDRNASDVLVQSLLVRSLDQELGFYRRLQRGLLTTASIVLPAALALGLLFARRITQPIQTLMREMQRIGRGEFDSQLTIPATDEFGELAKVFNRMTSELKRLLQQEKEMAEAAAEKRRAEELAQVNANLTKEVAKRREAEVEVMAKNKELETLLHVISHDLREPLRSVENFSGAVLNEHGGRLDEEGQDLLRRVVGGGSRMRRLLDDIQTLARARRITPPAEVVEGEVIVREALDRLAGTVQKTGAKIKVEKELPRLQVEKTWATEALCNLVSNALKFSREGRPPDVEIAAYRPGPGETDGEGFVVRDRGPGVAPEHAQRIFELFQRAVGREIEGTGAGLAIVQMVAERHGGCAWVRPREGGGSEFIITFGGPISRGGLR